MKEHRLREVRRRGKAGEAELERSRQRRRGEGGEGWRGEMSWGEEVRRKKWKWEERTCAKKKEGREKAGVRGEVKVWGREKVEEIRLKQQEVTGRADDNDRVEGTYDLSPAFSRVSSSRLLDLLTVCRTWSTTSDPWRQTQQSSQMKQEPRCGK